MQKELKHNFMQNNGTKAEKPTAFSKLFGKKEEKEQDK